MRKWTFTGLVYSNVGYSELSSQSECAKNTSYLISSRICSSTTIHLHFAELKTVSSKLWYWLFLSPTPQEKQTNNNNNNNNKETASQLLSLMCLSDSSYARNHISEQKDYLLVL